MRLGGDTKCVTDGCHVVTVLRIRSHLSSTMTPSQPASAMVYGPHIRHGKTRFEDNMFERRASSDERILRRYIETAIAFSETAPSISLKLGVSARTARRVLDRYAQIGLVQRRSLGG